MPTRRNSSSLSSFEGRLEERRKCWIGIWGQADSTVGYECWPEWPELVERPRGQLEQEKAISSAQLHHRPKTKPLDRLRPRPRRHGRVKGLAAAAAVHGTCTPVRDVALSSTWRQRRFLWGFGRGVGGARGVMRRGNYGCLMGGGLAGLGWGMSLEGRLALVDRPRNSLSKTEGLCWGP